MTLQIAAAAHTALAAATAAATAVAAAVNSKRYTPLSQCRSDTPQ